MIFDLREVETESLARISQYLDTDAGLYFFYRTRCISLQSNLDRYMDLDGAPLVFLHGNPHVDNYARVGKTAAMIDFDRSRMGPYLWDLIRFASGLMLKTKNSNTSLSPVIKEALTEGYLERIQDSSLGFEPVQQLMDVEPQEWETSTEAYIKHGKKWAKKLRLDPEDADDPYYERILKKYAHSRHYPELVELYDIEEVGTATGSLGNKRFLMHLKPHNKKSDHMLLDMKEVYRDLDTEYFYNPYRKHAHRMIEASQLYAPGVEKGLGYVLDKGKEFWVRVIPSFKAKIKGTLKESLAEELAYKVGCQLGMAHHRSCLFCSPTYLEKHFLSNKKNIFKVAEKMTKDIIKNYELFVDQSRDNIVDLVDDFFD